ncbi:3'-5' ssDNA/RNA exonuclease TatD-like [Asterias rubens]|uniref:3'-5' ssDNA/RNA exonuclease TatD-like n=1 Tax=Asterias rubens TaxID=7604 RepID=UPI0014552821|nr:3'-5' ssDNA/RNA exonuclease TatD-like [Asterias rubens]
MANSTENEVADIKQEAGGDAENVDYTNRKIYFGNLPFATTAEDLEKWVLEGISQPNAKDVKAEIAMDGIGRARGFGYIESPDEFKEAILKLHGEALDGRKLRVQVARDANSKSRFTGDNKGVQSNRRQRPRPVASKLLADPSHTYTLIDVGANLMHKTFGRQGLPSRTLKNVLKRAESMGVKKMVVTGTSIATTTAAQELVKKYEGTLYYTAGVHPHSAKIWDDTTMEKLEKLAADPACVAIGETGLDFNRNFSDPNIQEEVFEKQVQLACRLKKPLLLHEREAHSKLMEILMRYEEQLPACIIHCFTGTEDEVKTYVEKSFWIGLTGFVCQVDIKIPDMLKDGTLPLERVLLESNAPFMEPRISKDIEVWDSLKQVLECLPPLTYWSPFPRNEPAKLPIVCEIVAHFLQMEPNEVAEKTSKNACQAFDLDTE